MKDAISLQRVVKVVRDMKKDFFAQAKQAKSKQRAGELYFAGNAMELLVLVLQSQPVKDVIREMERGR